MKNVNFKKLCKIIVEKNGNPSCKDVLTCGYTMEHFIRLCQPCINTDELVKNAKKSLKEV